MGCIILFNTLNLSTIEIKVKNNIYPSISDFRANAILFYENSFTFNSIDYIITSAALKVKDTILKAISNIKESKSSTILRASTKRS
jgi:Bromodomain